MSFVPENPHRPGPRCWLRRLDDNYCDPLELRSEPHPSACSGLLQVAVRAGKVLAGQCAGAAAFWKARPARLLPGVSQALLGEPFATAPHCPGGAGEDAVLVEALERLPQRVIKPTYLAARREHMEPVLASQLDAASLHAWRERILRQPGDFTLQENVPLSQAPIWRHRPLSPPTRPCCGCSPSPTARAAGR